MNTPPITEAMVEAAARAMLIYEKSTRELGTYWLAEDYFVRHARVALEAGLKEMGETG